MLDVRKLLLLREVEARGSIAGAALALNYTRSAVSQHLSALEAETGVPLLDRTNGKATLTAVGKLLVGHGELILSQLEAAESQLQEHSGQVYGDLRIGVPFHEGPAMLVPTLVAMRREHSTLRITLHDTRGTEARQAVRLNQLDMVVAARYRQVPEPDVPGLSEKPFASDRIRLAVPPDHELAGTGPRELADFADEPWILDEDSALGRLTLHACHGAGFTPDAVAATDDMQVVLGLVSHGWGVALVPDLVPDRPGCPVARIDLTGAVLTREVSLVVRTGTVDCPSIAALLAAVRRDTGG
ncbi:LysR family transcriptional regulator [Streptomyces gibsoniae]|uniref:LysR family transcriptional regulator n=1 Tax=Streptomyces gibsoniae TaxID=3075529 RepID=A0ABU2U6U9_9ACTN|nr:LysR family transcriptional regulator [Streptomyces sp. DSM 41699]MDT0468952.1 LysR family transcriptional regulator [Streptomyces sp. DSM 41699]